MNQDHDISTNHERVLSLQNKGVKIPHPESVVVDEDVPLDQISSNGVTIYNGCRISGATTFIGDHVQIGSETPATLNDCQVGAHAEIKGGFFSGSVMLDHVSLGSGAHVRPGCILEEGASIAHTVGLKHTILFPFVTLGSLINFCDCLMAGGTSAKNHSEVGSSYVHFNFTPNQDKATASLIGNVPKGVMLDQQPIFLGGQGGLVGPSRLAFGTVIAAGSVYRKDQLKTNRLVTGSPVSQGASIPFLAGIYRNIIRIVRNNLYYIANLVALRQWYHHVRRLFVGSRFPEPIFNGLLKSLESGISERIARMDGFCEKISHSIDLCSAKVPTPVNEKALDQKKMFVKRWPSARAILIDRSWNNLNTISRDRCIESILKCPSTDYTYLSVIRQLSSEAKQAGTAWLISIVDQCVDDAHKALGI